MKKSANWMAWTFHGLFGLIIGSFAGVYISTSRRWGFWLRTDLIIPFLIGTALIGAGFGSRYGDRLWLGDNYRMLPPDEPEQSNISDWISWSLAASGFATCTVTLLKHFQFI